MTSRSVTQGNGALSPMDGKPRNRSRKWRLTVSCGKDRRTGKYVRKTRVVHGTQTQAKAALRDFIAELDAAIPKSDMPVSDWLDVWHESRKGSIAHTTEMNEQSRIRNLQHVLGGMRLSEIDAGRAESLYKALMDGDTPNGSPVSGSSAKLHHVTLKAALTAAVKDGLLPYNPIDAAKPPRATTDKADGMTGEQIARLVSALDPADYWHRAILLMVSTGIRRGECLALLWEDIDGCAVSISKAMDAYGNIKDTKTGNSRTVVMPQAVSDMLEPYRERPLCPVISPGAAEHAHPSSMTHWWKDNRAALGCDGVKLHGLRHAYISQLSREGVPVKVAQELAGHSSAAITLDVYTHATLDDKRKAAESFSHVFHTGD